MGRIFDKLQRVISRERAGLRFQDHYQAGHKARQDTSWGRRAGRMLRLLVALVATVIGVILAFIPGPAILFFILAGGLLSAESLLVARMLDWLELRIWALWSWGRRHWRNVPGWGRVALATAAVGLGAVMAYVPYHLLTR